MPHIVLSGPGLQKQAVCPETALSEYGALTFAVCVAQRPSIHANAGSLLRRPGLRRIGSIVLRTVASS